MWSSIIKPAVVLFSVCIVISGALAYVNDGTKDIIEARTKAEQEQFRKEVMKQAERFVEVKPQGIFDNVTGIYEGYSGENLVGYVMDVTTKGYGGSMSLTVGIDFSGQVSGVIIGENSETPGLGSKSKEPEFISQYEEVTINDEITVVKQNKKSSNEIQAISGATITSRGVTEGVQAALDCVKYMTEGGK